MQINFIKLRPTARCPQAMSELAAGYDLFADLDTPLTLTPGQTVLVPTGLALAIPAGYEGQVRPRSGLAIKHGLGILNAPGTIDADYRGEVKIVLHNFSQQPYVIEPGTRVAQLVVAPCTRVEFTLCEQLESTARGEGGFGSTNV